MTFLKNVVSFNIPVKELDCCQCKGTGKFKTQKYNGATMLFMTMVGLIWAFSFMTVFTKEPSYYIGLPFFIISTIIAIILFAEYKQQKLEETERNNENRVYSNR
jgi:uncharacterized membrane protein